VLVFVFVFVFVCVSFEEAFSLGGVKRLLFIPFFKSSSKFIIISSHLIKPFGEASFSSPINLSEEKYRNKKATSA